MKKQMIFMAAAAALFSACQSEVDNGPVTESRTIKISPVMTRATEVDFENEDRIGLTIVKADGTKYVDNAMFTYADGVFSGGMTWYSEAGDPSTFVAYYPYSSAGVPSSFTVSADQSGAGYGASDLMAASKTGVLPSANAVTMVFKRLMSKIVVNVTNQSGGDIRSVSLRGAIPTGDVDIEALTVSVDEDVAAADIKTGQVTQNAVYRAILVPQQVALTLVVVTADNKTLTQQLAAATLVKGGQYSVTARVLPDDLEVALSGEIENWTDEGEIAPGVVPFEEHLDENYFLYDGVKYNTVKLSNGQIWMAAPLCYVPDGYTPSADPAVDSHIWYPYELEDESATPGANTATPVALTDDASVLRLGLLYDYEVALGGGEITGDNMFSFEGAQGICPTGWHIPTRTEYLGLCGLSNKDDSGTETGNVTKTDALFFDAGYNGGKFTKFNDAGWNYVRSGARMKSGFAAAPAYQKTQLYSGNTTGSSWVTAADYGSIALTYIMSSTGYKLNYSTSDPSTKTNLQFFAQMTTFTNTYPDGKINVAYAHYESGLQVRCMKNE